MAHQDISLKTGQSWEKRDVWEPYSSVICLVFFLLVSVNASPLPANLNLNRSSTNNFLQLKNTQLLILFLDTVLKCTCRITVSVDVYWSAAFHYAPAVWEMIGIPVKRESWGVGRGGWTCSTTGRWWCHSWQYNVNDSLLQGFCTVWWLISWCFWRTYCLHLTKCWSDTEENFSRLCRTNGQIQKAGKGVSWASGS